MTEAGMPGVEGGPWFGLFAPAGTPRAAIDWINAQANKAFSAPELQAAPESDGADHPARHAGGVRHACHGGDASAGAT